MRKTVFVAMSGGVDSSVAALLLKRQGLAVVGVFMKNWSQEIPGVLSCSTQEDQRFARLVAAQLDIPFYTWDFEKEYRKTVFDYMIRGYKEGITPNPDVVCNKEIKFGLFLKKALKLGADYIGTGHYVRKLVTSDQQLGPFYRLLKAKDKNKDQSYFLWTLNQEQLKRCLFPVGDYLKSEVRRIAKEFGLSTAERKDSQGLCFVGKLDFSEFLKIYLGEQKGEIIELILKETSWQKRVIGYHKGLHFFTLGQRRGIGIGGGKPYYVVLKDMANKVLYVSFKEHLERFFPKEVFVSELNFISGLEPKPSSEFWVRWRYRQPLEKAVVKAVERKEGKMERLKVLFEKSAIGITPGQSLVFYKNEELVGGGVIDKQYFPSSCFNFWGPGSDSCNLLL